MTDATPRLNAALEGRYRVERELGEGGMATVYLADDLKHERQVALKVLKPELAAVVGAERFLAEIKTTANLQHPHILPLFDSGEADGFLFYVMPYVEGETLRERLDREKQLAVEEAVEIATKVAGALQAAHGRGVIHRDIKPANILLGEGGEPLVADFGIALAVQEAGGGRLTETGLSMGTPFYMSPEQASADREPSAASDVYSLGCVLYEMLVGDPPYTASSAQGVLAKILTEDAKPPTGSRASIPPNVDAAVRKALQRVPADRFRSAEDFARALADPGFTHGASRRQGEGDGTGRWSRPAVVHLALTATLAALALWGWLRPTGASTPEATPVRMVLSDFEFSDDADRRPVISRDGSFLVVRGPDEEAPYLVRPVDRTQFREISGTENGLEATISPDGRWLAFRRGTRIYRVELSGGTPLPVAEGYDPHWGAAGTIVFGTLEGEIYAVSPGGGDPVLLLSEDETARGSHPHLLPGGEALVFQGSRPGDGNTTRLLLLDLASGLATDLGIEGSNPIYVESGHLLFTRGDQSLMAVPFDPEGGRVTGPSFTALTGIMNVGEQEDGAISVSSNGTAIYLRGSAPERAMVEYGLDGSEVPLRLGPGDYLHPKYSPDGRHIVFEQGGAIWVHDRVTGASERLVEGSGRYPVWSPDGRYLYYSPVWQALARTPIDGSTAPETFYGQDGFVFPWSVSPSGTDIVLAEWLGPERGMDLEVLSMEDGGARVRDFLGAAHHEVGGEVSPDGGWVAYTSDESGDARVYLRRLADASGQIDVSGEERANWPVWSRDGRALLFLRFSEEGVLLVRAPVTWNGPDVTVGTPVPVIPIDYVESTSSFSGRNWDLSPDGTRLVTVTGIEGEGTSTSGATAEIVVNWFSELRALSGG